MKEIDKHKCQWCQDGGLMEHYHDTEWGIPCHDDKRLFEYLMLEAMSCGLSWNLMLQKREIFHACFADFDYKKVAEFTKADIDRAMAYPGMIRSRRKIEAIVSNAKCFMQIQQECGSFDKYLWAYSEGKTFIYQSHLDGVWLTKNDLSDTIAADLKKRGFKFLGSTLIYSYLQSVGIINDHAPECRMFEKIGGTISIKITSMKHKVKVTVIDKKLYPELQRQYCADPDSGMCPCYNVGDEFIFERDEQNDHFWHGGLNTLVKTTADPNTVAGGPKMPHCSEAWDAISRYIYTGLQGGSIMNGWMKRENEMICCCSDGTRPVIFKIERIDEE